MRTYMPTWAEINLDNILCNYQALKSLTQDGTKACAIIKANAYGHGSVEIAKHLEKHGCDYFGVATANEALELRQHGIKAPLMCLAYVEDSLYKEFIEKDIDLPLFSYKVAEEVSKAAAELGKYAKIHIKLDTGMSRVGFAIEDQTIEEIQKIAKLPNLILQGIYTHFAMADTNDRTETDLQFEKYKFIVDTLESEGIYFKINHVCNSAATMQYPEYHLDMVRLGIALYGHAPSDEMDTSMVELKPAMTLKSRVTHVKQLEAGRGISYGHKYHVEGETESIATMPIGYADGFTRMLSGKADVFIHGKQYPVVGRICMDQSMVKVDEHVKLGDEITIFSGKGEMAIERLAARLQTINYELLCMVQRRIPRVYIVNGEKVQTVNYLLDELLGKK